MNKKLLGLILSLIGISVLGFGSGAEEGKATYTCPLCGEEFEAPAAPEVTFESQFSDAKSMDSDFCSHAEGGAPLFQTVVSCPKCMYSAYAKEFSHSLRDDQKARLKAMLEQNPPPASVKQGQIPAWRSWKYAAWCYKITRSDILFHGQTFHGAAYCARIEATAEATAKLSFEGPESVLPLLEELEKKISAENNRQKKAELMLAAARAAQRGGFVDVRDKWITQLRKEAGSDDAIQQQIEKFSVLVAAEEKCLQEALACYKTAMYEALIPSRNVPLYNYLIADIMRRLGRRRSPVVGYYAHILEADKARADLKRLANYFIQYLNRI